MDSFVSQSIPPQQVVSQPVVPPKAKGIVKTVLNLGTWIILFALLPFTVLIFLSQDSIPGDLFYPVKRGLEGVILAAASVSPSTRAAFRTDLTTRRFDEAEELLLGSSTNGLQDFVTEIQAAQNEVSAISDPVKKQELQQKIQTSVTEYEKRLDVVKVKLVEQEEINQLALAPTNIPTPIPTSIPTALPTKTQVVASISPTQIPTSTSAPQPTPVPPITPGTGIIVVVDDVGKYLNCLQNTPPPHGECVAPQLEPNKPNEEKQKQEERRKELEKRMEAKEKREKKQENEKKDSSLENDSLKNTH